MSTTTSRPLAQSAASINLRKAVLYVNGAFLALMGGLFGIFDLLSYWFGSGPLGELYFNVPMTVGLFEAHGLALILGLLLLRAARSQPSAIWHLVGAGIHILLGSSNLIFWSLFLIWDVVTAEIVVTSIHWLLAAVQLVCIWRARVEAERR
jgi:hypothetical protein